MSYPTFKIILQCYTGPILRLVLTAEQIVLLNIKALKQLLIIASHLVAGESGWGYQGRAINILF